MECRDCSTRFFDAAEARGAKRTGSRRGPDEPAQTLGELHASAVHPRVLNNSFASNTSESHAASYFGDSK